MNAQPAQPDGSRVALPCGAFAAYTCFAYDLYVVDDNGGLDDEFLQRLKNRELFQGARHELFAEATCYRAGFTVQHEDEKDGSTRHAEFTVRHAATGQLLSIEAKSRHRAGVLAMPGMPEEKPRLRLMPLINDAVAKNAKHPLVIFVDANLPFKWAERVLGRQAGNTISPPIQTLLDRIKKQHNDADPYCMIIFSNHPHHYAVRDLDPQQHLLSVVSQQPSAHMLSLRSLFMAAGLYGNIPMGFSMEEGDPPPPAVPVVWPKVRYDLQVAETDVSVLREGKASTQKVFDHGQRPSTSAQRATRVFGRYWAITCGCSHDLQGYRRRQIYIGRLRDEVERRPGGWPVLSRSEGRDSPNRRHRIFIVSAPPPIHHIQRVIALTDILRAIRNNENGLAKAELCPSPETEPAAAREPFASAL